MTADGLDELRAGLDRMQRMLGSRRVQARLTEASGVELSQQAISVLRVLPEGERFPVADVARRARMDVGAVSRQLRALETAGLVTREASTEHGSVVLVQSTEAGRAALARVEDVRRRHLRDALASWPAEQRAELGRLMTRLVEDLQRTPYRRE